MKAAIFVKPGQMECRQIDQPTIQQPTDALIKVVRDSVCGSDMWWYRGITPYQSGNQEGHEAIGIVEAVGDQVTHVKPGDFVICPFTHGCGHCPACLAGFEGNCQNFGYDIKNGYQAEYLRYTGADWSLVKVPGQPSDYTDEQLNDLLTLADVMATGYHAANLAHVQAGDTTVVMGDGAVGLCGVIAAKLRGAKRIILMSRHEDRQQLGQEFGATDFVAERGDEAVQKVLQLTHGAGADSVLECVGTELAMKTCFGLARAGAVIGGVGVPQNAHMVNLTDLFGQNIGVQGGTASVTTYDRQVLLKAVLNGQIHPGHVFTRRFDLDHINEAYSAMDKRQAIKSLLIVSQ